MQLWLWLNGNHPQHTDAPNNHLGGLDLGAGELGATTAHDQVFTAYRPVPHRGNLGDFYPTNKNRSVMAGSLPQQQIAVFGGDVTRIHDVRSPPPAGAIRVAVYQLKVN